MIFPNLRLEDVVQINDKTRLDATKSFVSKDEASITLVEIEPESGAGFIAVGAPGVAKDWFIDWEYATDGTKTVSCRITTDGAPTTKSFTLEVLSAADDYLFSTDADIVSFEHDILRYVPEGRSSFNNYHRKAQRLIMAWLDENGHTDVNGDRLTPQSIIDKEEVKSWSAALTLSLIYQTLSNDPNDIFSVKSTSYAKLAATHRSRLIIRLDANGDSTVSLGEGVNVKSLNLIRR